jgi:hypothetical protein
VRDWETFTFGAEEEASNFSETLILIYQTTGCFIPEELGNLIFKKKKKK